MGSSGQSKVAQCRKRRSHWAAVCNEGHRRGLWGPIVPLWWNCGATNRYWNSCSRAGTTRMLLSVCLSLARACRTFRSCKSFSI